MILMAVAAYDAAAQTKPKFTDDQCRVLLQIGVDISQICPDLKFKPKSNSGLPFPELSLPPKELKGSRHWK